MLIPCIDLQGGQAVQLVHGRKRELAVTDVLGLLEKFKKYPWLHVIDLDAAMGKGANDDLVRKLCAKARNDFGMKVRVGGGIRTISRAQEVAGWGANQIVVGSAAFRGGKVNTGFLRLLTKKVRREQIIIALDTARGNITIHGWRKSIALQAEKVMAQLEPFCAGFLCRRNIASDHRRWRHRDSPRHHCPRKNPHGRRRWHGPVQEPIALRKESLAPVRPTGTNNPWRFSGDTRR